MRLYHTSPNNNIYNITKDGTFLGYVNEIQKLQRFN